jgi:hypothetical protein
MPRVSAVTGTRRERLKREKKGLLIKKLKLHQKQKEFVNYASLCYPWLLKYFSSFKGNPAEMQTWQNHVDLR